MDPTVFVKSLFGDLLMQIALLQAELDACKQELAKVKTAVKDE
jgi:hypothetical protein